MTQKKAKPRARIHRKRRVVKPGLAPGTLVADPTALKPTIGIIAYDNGGEFLETVIQDVGEIPALREKWPTLWINVVGLGDIPVIEQLGEMFGLHRLALEDVLNVHHQPKAESFDNCVFVVMRLIMREQEISGEQISMFLGEDYLLTFQERPGDCFDAVRGRIRKGKGRIRAAGVDYLAYALLDALVDHNFALLDAFGESLEALQEEVMDRPDENTIAHVFSVKTELLQVRRSVWPMRELVASLMRDDDGFFKPETMVFLRDCHDHVIQVIDLMENFRDIASGLVDMYLSSVSNRMNEVMKVLTIIATIFIPLGFLAGLYGMNFNPEVSPFNMPELGLRYGYPLALGMMATVAVGMLVYFRRKGWILRSRKR